jgi:hypothetical protein
LKEERRTRSRHPVRNYLLFAILTLAVIAFLGLRTEHVSGARSEVLGGAPTASCRLKGRPIALPDVPEASGVAVSRRTAGLLWTVADHGKPVLYAVHASGELAGRVAVTGARVEDWEDLAAGPCGDASCLYIGDIGDNAARRKSISVYRVREPAPGDAATQRAEAFRASYPDGPQDAETLLVTQDGRLLVVTKGDNGPVTLYRFPEPLHEGVTVRLEKLATLVPGSAARDERVTGGSVSADGSRVALRTHASVLVYDAHGFARGQLARPLRFDVAPLGEPQGEGVAFDANGDLVLASEGAGKGQPGSLARAGCPTGAN